MEGQIGWEGDRRRPVWENELGIDLLMLSVPRSPCGLHDFHTALSPQYSTLIRHSIGALATLKKFFSWNNRCDKVRSASSPTANVAVAIDRPMMVRYCMCQPYESLLCFVVRRPAEDRLVRWHTLGLDSARGRRKSMRKKQDRVPEKFCVSVMLYCLVWCWRYMENRGCAS